MQQLHQALGGTGGAQQVAIDLAQHRKGARQDDHIHHGLSQVSGRHPALHDRLRALVEAPEQRGGRCDDDEGHQHRAGPGAAHRRHESLCGRMVKARGLATFGGVALHHGNGVEHLGRDGAGVGHTILAGARELANPPPEPQGGQHHAHQHHGDLQHHPRVGPDQHGQRAHAHDGIAQPHAERGAHHGLHQRGVRGQARQHLAGLCGLEELGALLQHMGIDGVAQVRRHPLAQPADHVEAAGGKDAQGDGHGKQCQKMPTQGHDLCSALGRGLPWRRGCQRPTVDQTAQGQREGQRRQCREQKKQPGQKNAGPIGPQER